MNIFYECSKLTMDSYWKSYFIDCSNNKFPRGMKYNDQKNVIICNEHRISLNDNIKYVYKNMMNLFQNVLYITSPSDEIHICKISDDLTKCLNMSWKKIKLRYIRNDLIHDYIYNLQTIKKKYKLIAVSVILLGIRFKQLSVDDIIIENGCIIDIKNIIVNDNGIILCKKIKTKTIYMDKIKKNDLEKNIDNYMKSISIS